MRNSQIPQMKSSKYCQYFCPRQSGEAQLYTSIINIVYGIFVMQPYSNSIGMSAVFFLILSLSLSHAFIVVNLIDSIAQVY